VFQLRLGVFGRKCFRLPEQRRSVRHIAAIIPLLAFNRGTVGAGGKRVLVALAVSAMLNLR
jgi:hypothetical protein